MSARKAADVFAFVLMIGALSSFAYAFAVGDNVQAGDVMATLVEPTVPGVRYTVRIILLYAVIIPYNLFF